MNYRILIIIQKLTYITCSYISILINKKLNKYMVTLTNSAKEYMQSVSNGAYVTLGVKSGGCSGFEYQWGLSTDTDKEHIEWSAPIDNVLLLDPMAEMYIFGSEIDYITELGGSFLTINNPTASNSCGCGDSFGI